LLMTAVKPSALNCRNAPGEGCSATASFWAAHTNCPEIAIEMTEE
jgi:hypothetical protein